MDGSFLTAFEAVDQDVDRLPEISVGGKGEGVFGSGDGVFRFLFGKPFCQGQRIVPTAFRPEDGQLCGVQTGTVRMRFFQSFNERQAGTDLFRFEEPFNLINLLYHIGTAESDLFFPAAGAQRIRV